MRTMTARTMPALDVKVESTALTRGGRAIATRRFYKSLNPTAVFRLTMRNHTDRPVNVTIAANIYRRGSKARAAGFAKRTVSVPARGRFTYLYNVSPLTDLADGGYDAVFYFNDRRRTVGFTLEQSRPAPTNDWIRIR